MTDNKKKILRIILLVVLPVLAFFVVGSATYLYLTQKDKIEVILYERFGSEVASKVAFQTYTVSFSEGLDSDLVLEIKETLEVVEYNEIPRYEFVEKDSDIEFGFVGINQNIDPMDVLYTSNLVPVGHFYWIKDGVSVKELEDSNILVNMGTKSLVSKILNQMGISSNIEETETLSEDLKASEDKIGIIDIKDLNIDYKLLNLDDSYFLDNPEKGSFPYVITVVNHSAPSYIEEAIGTLIESIGSEEKNLYVEDSILKINMTGVTALSRNLAIKIEASGNSAYPAELIGPFLSDADLTHTSNEVSFVPGCVPTQSLSFCSSPDYIESLKISGVDIVELTGNHNNDYGQQYNKASIEEYISQGWDYFGGGLNDSDASEILYKEVDGSKVAFIGYNYYDTILGTGALASSTTAGANSYSLEKMEQNIKEAKGNGATVIVDFQFQECYSYPASDIIYPYCYKPLGVPDQKEVFRAAIDLGADVVIGTQAHQPQTYEIYNGKPIFYGLGNLYFDQIPWIGTRQGLVLTHYFFSGELIQTKITTTLYDKDMKTYVSEGADRVLLLELLRDARP